MKDLIEKLITYLPRYFVEFATVFSGPKKFMTKKNSNTESSFNDSLLFLSISMSLSVIMTSPLLSAEKDIWEHLGTRAIITFLGVALASLALRVCWRIVGGKASFKSFFVTYAYYSGIIIVLLTLFMLLGEGVFKVIEPDLYEKALVAQAHKTYLPELKGKIIPQVSFGIILFGYVVASSWALIGWGAYRQLNNLSKIRSFVAFVLMGPFGWLIFIIVFFITSAMS